MSAAKKKEATKESKIDREVREMIEGEEELLADGLGVDEPDWRQFLFDESKDSPGIRQRKLETFMRTFVLWRCGMWEAPRDEEVPSETVQARRRVLALRTKEARG